MKDEALAVLSTLCQGVGVGEPGARMHAAYLVLGAATVSTTVGLCSRGCETFKSQNLLRSLLVMIWLPRYLGSREIRS